MAAKYLIQEETLTATADKIRKKLGILSLCELDPEYVDGNGNLAQEVTVYYVKYIDSAENYTDKEGDDGLNLVCYAYLTNNEGKIVPVLLDDYVKEKANLFYYEGTETIDGVVYDKWRKISSENDDYEKALTWDSEAKCYKYTDVIVNPNINKYSPTDFPAKIDEVYDVGYNDGRGGITSIISNGKTITIEAATVTVESDNTISLGG